jgi:F-type H+-transporting ATPase subunit b
MDVLGTLCNTDRLDGQHSATLQDAPPLEDAPKQDKMDIDITILFQLGIFLVLLTVLNVILFRPFLRLLEKRYERIEGRREQAELLRSQGTADSEAYQLRMREARAAAQREREALRNQGRQEQRRLLNQARAEIAASLNHARRAISEAEEITRKNLSAGTSALARQLVAKVLGAKEP